MFKTNLSNSSKLPLKKKPVLFKENADDTPYLGPVSQEPYETPKSMDARGNSSAFTSVDMQRRLGGSPSFDERFRGYQKNKDNQEKETTGNNNIILNDIMKKKYASVLAKIAEQFNQNAELKGNPVKTYPFSGNPYVQPRQNDQSDASGVPLKTTGSTNGIPDEHAELAAIVAKLPEGFNLTKWDDRSAFQQQNLLKKSGLSGTDQMKLLNAPTSIETISTIQILQANRAQYGITQAKADQKSAELLKIANARIGVNNRALPFASDFQRNLFLKQLDKEEQKLLETVDGQENRGRDMLFKENRWFDSDRPEKTSKPKVITEVDNNSKLASVAKDVLKAFVGIQYILTISLILLANKEVGKLLDEGTVSFGTNLNASVLIAGGPTGNVGIAMDTTGDIGIVRVLGGYAGIPSVSLVGYASVSNAKRLRDLEGFTLEAGGTIGEGLCVGAEVGTFNDKSGKQKCVVNLLGGLGASALPVEGHVAITYTYPFEDEDGKYQIVNIYEKWEKFVKEYLEW
jgi:hypothetical protein